MVSPGLTAQSSNSLRKTAGSCCGVEQLRAHRMFLPIDGPLFDFNRRDPSTQRGASNRAGFTRAISSISASLANPAFAAAAGNADGAAEGESVLK